jgi:tetratricopeptide (TPR) repeat protein
MYKVTLVLIARNEAPSISRCLDSVRAYVDQMLVLNTGSSDATVQLARDAGARVEHFTWIDDFSAARNHALDLAQSDWNLVLDADEWLFKGGEDLAALKSMRPDFVGAICINSDFDSNGVGASASSLISRVLPNNVRYRGRIHEQPIHQLRVAQLAVHVGHSGYTPQAMATKQGRNAGLLKQALLEAPGDGYLLYQLGKDHAVYERFEAASDCFSQATLLLDPDSPLTHDLLLRWVYALKKCGKHEDAVQLAEAHMGRWEGSPDYWFVIGDLLLDWACEQPERSTTLLPMIEASWQRCLEIGELPDLEGSVHGRGSYSAAHNLSIFYDGVGRSDEAKKYHDMATAPFLRP